MADKLQMRGDTERNWMESNPIISDRELVFSVDITPVKMKIGNGVTSWKDLDYFAGLIGKTGEKGDKGEEGLSIKSANVDDSNHLILTFTDGSSVDVGVVKGSTGASGVPATISIGKVTTGNAGSQVSITNVGTSSDVIFDFVIPRGDNGINGSGTGDMLKETYDSVGDGVVNKARTLSDIVADPTTSVPYTLKGSVDQFLSWITKRFESALGYAWGVVIPFSLKQLAEQADIGTLFIPAGGTYSPITRAGRNRTYNKVFVDCHGENPTSLVITLFHNETLIYTSPVITTNETVAIVNLPITGEQKVQAFTSNTIGLTKGISVSLKQVNR